MCTDNIWGLWEDETYHMMKHLKNKTYKISHINNSSTAVLREFDFVDGEILIILCGLISVVTKYLIFMSIMSMKKKE